MAFWRWRRAVNAVESSNRTESDDFPTVKEVVSQVLASNAPAGNRGDALSHGNSGSGNPPAQGLAVLDSPSHATATPGAILRTYAGLTKPVANSNSSPIPTPGSVLRSETAVAAEMHDAEEMFDASASPLSASPRVTGLSDVLIDGPGSLGQATPSLLTRRVISNEQQVEVPGHVTAADDRRPVRRAHTVEEPAGAKAEPSLSTTSTAGRPRGSLSQILGQAVDDGSAKKVTVSQHELESLEGRLAEMEQQCALLSAALEKKKKNDTESIRGAVDSVWKHLQEERVSFGSTMRSVKESLMRSREERRQGRHVRQDSKRISSYGGSATTATAALTHRSNDSVSNVQALQGPPQLQALPAPLKLATHENGLVPGGGGILVQAEMGTTNGQAGWHPQEIIARGPQPIEASGRRGRQLGAGPVMWQQPDGLLVPVSEYQSIESRRDRAAGAGSCFMGLSPFGMGNRRTGQKGSRQQRWVVDNSWMDALRKEFLALHGRMLDAEEQSLELQQILEEKYQLEQKVLDFIEKKQLHDEEVERILSKVAKLHVTSSPSSPASDD